MTIIEILQPYLVLIGIGLFIYILYRYVLLLDRGIITEAQANAIIDNLEPGAYYSIECNGDWQCSILVYSVSDKELLFVARKNGTVLNLSRETLVFLLMNNFSLVYEYKTVD